MVVWHCDGVGTGCSRWLTLTLQVVGISDYHQYIVLASFAAIKVTLAVNAKRCAMFAGI